MIRFHVDTMKYISYYGDKSVDECDLRLQSLLMVHTPKGKRLVSLLEVTPQYGKALNCVWSAKINHFYAMLHIRRYALYPERGDILARVPEQWSLSLPISLVIVGGNNQLG